MCIRDRLYTAVSLVLAPIAFGAVQARVSEAFTLLPVLVPVSYTHLRSR